MPADPEEVKARLAELRRSYVEQLPGKLRDIDEAWTRLRGGPWSAPDFQSFHRAVHALAGSGAMFGFEQVSAKARSLDQVLKSLGDQAPDPETAGLISEGLASIREAVAP